MDQSPASQTPQESKPTIRRNASWGAIISIVIILAMIIVGALYAWGQKLAQIQAAKEAQQSVSF